MQAIHLIIEGPDGTGKTTLAKALCDSGGYAYRHEGPPPPGVGAFDHYTDVLDSLQQRTLLDRFHLGELVYGPLLRGKSGLTDADMQRIRWTLHDMGVQVILCLPPLPVALNNWLQRSQAGKEFFADPIVYASSFIGFHNLRHEADVIYDYTRDSVDLNWLTTIRRNPWRLAS